MSHKTPCLEKRRLLFVVKVQSIVDAGSGVEVATEEPQQVCDVHVAGGASCSSVVLAVVLADNTGSGTGTAAEDLGELVLELIDGYRSALCCSNALWD